MQALQVLLSEQVRIQPHRFALWAKRLSPINNNDCQSAFEEATIVNLSLKESHREPLLKVKEYLIGSVEARCRKHPCSDGGEFVSIMNV
jgi:hypothetical protein